MSSGSSSSGTPRKVTVVTTDPHLLGPCLSDVTLTPTPQKLLASAQSTRSSTVDSGSANRFMSPPVTSDRRRSSAPSIHQFTMDEEGDISTDEEADDYGDHRRRRANRQGIKSQRVWSPNEETIGWGGNKYNDNPDAFSVHSPRLTDVGLLAERRAWESKMSSVKLLIKLSILFRILHFIALGCLGFPYHISLWESLSVQLFLSVVASLALLWRLSGRYGFPRHLAPGRMFRQSHLREKRCLVIHGLCKLAAAATLFVTSALQKGRLKLSGPDYTAVTYLAGGVTAGGFVLHLVFLIAILVLMKNGMGRTFSSITSELNFTYLILFASTEVIIFTIISNVGPTTTKSATIYRTTEICLGVVALLAGCWDIWKATRHDKDTFTTSDGKSTSPLDLQFEPAFYVSTPPYRQ